MGRLVADPELKRTQTGLSIANFKIAVDRTIKKEGKSALFLPVTFFGSTAENISKIFRKGYLILVTGRLENDEFQDRVTGEKKTIYFLNGTSFDRIFDPKDSETPQNDRYCDPKPAIQDSGNLDDLCIEDDDTPF